MREETIPGPTVTLSQTLAFPTGALRGPKLHDASSCTYLAAFSLPLLIGDDLAAAVQKELADVPERLHFFSECFACS